MSNQVGQYARVTHSLAAIASVLAELSAAFAAEQRTAVDDSMIDALVASANSLATQATALKSIDAAP